jgi:hypothetical protein
MTESEWLHGTYPGEMLKHLAFSGTVDARKFRLFACACCRRISHLLTDERSRKAVEVAERFADGWADEEELRAACERAAEVISERAAERTADRDPYDVGHCAAVHASEYTEDEESLLDTVYCAASAAGTGSHSPYTNIIPPASTTISAWSTVPLTTEGLAQIALIRCIFGNPFRPVGLSRSWQTLKVVKLAQVIYDQRDFGRMPELGEALEEAGCTDADILAHCREPGPHVRGCWVVDLVLGKE